MNNNILTFLLIKYILFNIKVFNWFTKSYDTSNLFSILNNKNKALHDKTLLD